MMANSINSFRSTVSKKLYSWFNPSIPEDGFYHLVNPFPMILPTIQLAIIAGIANVMMGYNLSVLNTAMPIITGDFGWCGITNIEIVSPYETVDWNLLECIEAKSTQGIINSSLIFGAACGSLGTSALMSKIGRRLSLVAVLLGFVFSGILASISTGFISLLVSRFLTGIFAGLATVAPAVYITEMAPAHQKGIYGLVPTICTNLGVLFGICMGFPLKFPSPGFPLSIIEWNTNTGWWRQMLAIPLILSLFAAIALLKIYTFDTPEAIRLSGKSAASVETFLWLPFNSPKSSTNSSIAKTERPTLSLIQAYRLPALRWRLMGGWILAGCQQFSGMAVFVALSNTLFAQGGVPGKYLTIASAAMAFLQLLCSTIALQHLDRWPRKLIIGGGSSLMGICLVPAIISGFTSKESFTQYTSIISILSFSSIYGLTYGPGLLIYLSELYPAEIRDIGLSIAFAFNWSASFIVILIASILTQLQCFILFAGVCLFTAFTVITTFPETRSPSAKYFNTNSSIRDIEFSVFVNSSSSTVEPTGTDHSE